MISDPFGDLINLSFEELKGRYGNDIFKSKTEMDHIKGKFYKIFANNFKVNCFYPAKEICPEKTIRAHSLPRSLLSRLVDPTNHILMFDAAFETDKRPQASIKKIGINEATTFTGLCPKHDCEVFKPIENDPMDCFGSEHKFLLCYRALLKELFTKTMTYNISKQIVEIAKNDLHQGGLTFMGISTYCQYLGWFYLDELKKLFDICLLSKNFDGLLDYGLRIIDKFVPLSACSVFTPRYDKNNNVVNDFQKYKEMPKYVFLTIIPFSSKTYIFYATLKHQVGELMNFIAPLKESKTEELYGYLSEIILKDVDNFVISPEHWNKFGGQKQKDIINYFNETLFDKKIKYNPKMHNLFGE